MESCELCGKKENVFNTDVEGINLRVCTNCCKYGRVKVNSSLSKSYNNTSHRTNLTGLPHLKIIDNFSQVINQKRKEMGLTLTEFAKLINQRESIVSKWQNGAIKPDLELAKCLGKKLKIQLIQDDEIIDKTEAPKISRFSKNELTVEDFLNTKLNINKHSKY